jgi:hypothetical protein
MQLPQICLQQSGEFAEQAQRVAIEGKTVY